MLKGNHFSAFKRCFSGMLVRITKVQDSNEGNQTSAQGRDNQSPRGIHPPSDRRERNHTYHDHDRLLAYHSTKFYFLKRFSKPKLVKHFGNWWFVWHRDGIVHLTHYVATVGGIIL